MKRLNFLSVFIALVLAIAIPCVSAAAPIANDVTDNTDEDTAVIVTLDYTDADLDDATSCLVTNENNGVITTACSCDGSGVCTVGLTPATDSTASITADYTVNDGSGDSNTATITVTVNSDAPTWESNVNFKEKMFAEEGETRTIDFSNAATSTDPSDLTYTAVLDEDMGDSSFSGSILTIGEDEDVGAFEVEITVENSDGENITKTFTILVIPEELFCEDVSNCAFQHNDNIELDIDEPDNNDDFVVGEDIEFEITVKVDDDYDIVVEAILYDLTSDDEIASYESDSIDIDDGDDEDFEFEIKIPVDNEDLEDSDDYYIFVKAYDDGNEDEDCVMEWIKVNLEREKDAAVISNINIVPSIAYPGDLVTVEITALSIGTNDQDGVSIRIQQDLLNVNLLSKLFNLGDYNDKDNDYTYKFTIDVPEDATIGTYNILAEIYDEDEDIYDYDDATRTESFEVKSKSTEEPEEDGETVLDIPTTTTTIPDSTAITGSTTFIPTGNTKELVTNIFWIIGDIALLLMAIYFIKLIFFRPRI